MSLRALALLFVLLLPGTASAFDWDLHLRMGSRWITDRQFDLLSETDGVFRMELGAGAALTESLTLELDYFFSTTQTLETFGDTTTGFSSNGVSAGLRYSQPVSRISSLLVRGGGILEWASANLTDPVDEEDFDDEVLLLGVEGTAGWALRFPLEDATVQILAEAGYGYFPTKAEFVVGNTRIGSLDLSGPLLRIGGSLHF